MEYIINNIENVDTRTAFLYGMAFAFCLQLISNCVPYIADLIIRFARFISLLFYYFMRLFK